jgi:hypothetical protein
MTSDPEFVPKKFLSIDADNMKHPTKEHPNYAMEFTTAVLSASETAKLVKGNPQTLSINGT